MKGTVMNVHIKQIVPIYTETTSEAFKSRMVNCIRNGESLSQYLVLEQDPDKKSLYLISGYAAYEAYKKAGLSYIDCIVRPFSGRTEQMIQLLQSMFHNSGSNWIDKSIIISQLLDKSLSIKEIAKRVGVEGKDLERYLLHPEIPIEIADKAYQLQCVPLVDKIRRLCISDILKYRLYEKAVLNKKNPSRLTHDQLNKVKWLFNFTRFYELYDIESQWRYILKMLDYKMVLISMLQFEIETELSQWGSTSGEDDFPRLPN
ncbi:ParB/RepB/Spo0J family partition protein [Bacillus thuringiensis]|uniref:ParB/RepB/Spo0J family partition protein n=1 Tax=Bacillus thuringiensis TaxID=1428 RepID=UPI0005CEC92C|nr:ParB/RepB/Spo0J family partition protein [Bacillus thuringiensis]